MADQVAAADERIAALEAELARVTNHRDRLRASLEESWAALETHYLRVMADVALLAPRQLAVARLLANELSRTQICAQLSISKTRVCQHVQRIAEKWKLDPTTGDVDAQIAGRLRGPIPREALPLNNV